VTLAQRLLLAIGVLTIATTLALGLGVRDAWRRTEEDRFREQFQRAAERLRADMVAELGELPARLGALCQHDPTVDSALVDLEARRLDPGRRLSLSIRVPDLMRALGFDELTLVTGEGEVLGAGHAAGLVGTRDPALARLVAEPPETRAQLRSSVMPRALVAHCTRTSGAISVGLVGARHLEPLIAQASSETARLSLSPPPIRGDLMVEAVVVPELGGMALYATESRIPLYLALRRLDFAVLAIGVTTFAAALLVAMLLSRGLARPIVELSRQAREAVRGEPKPVQGRGGRELEELGAAFNQAIQDLGALRRRLAASERIAAQREIARRVAHEIKNPLAPIRTAVETLRRLRARGDPAFDEYFDEASRTVLEEVARINHIVTEFTRFARLPPPQPAPLDLAEIARKVVGLHSPSRAELRLVTEPCGPITADRDQLVQVLTNLVQNALEACEHANHPEVEVRVEPCGPGGARLMVRDNGPGIAPEMRDRLFLPYATTKEKGTGLGLAMVQHIVTEHGGEVAYRDAPGGGAEFVVTLTAEGPAPRSDAAPYPPSGDGRFGRSPGSS
jgi:two-component system, NtrC family, nitrogen regulation sensor histidine kinase NtrY